MRMSPSLALLGSFVLGLVASLAANRLSPSFNFFIDNILSRLFHALNPDALDLSGTWRQSCAEPTSATGDIREIVFEVIYLKHLGARISAKGKMEGDGREFLYDLRLKQRLVFGAYSKSGAKGSVTGTGMVQLIVSPDCKKLSGQATWFDSDTQRIESSGVEWILLASQK